MNKSPQYAAIKSRALALLRAGGINNHSWDELKAFAHSPVDKWTLHNSVGVALCMARDEIEIVTYPRDEYGLLIVGRRSSRTFNKGNHQLAQREIIRELKVEP